MLTFRHFWHFLVLYKFNSFSSSQLSTFEFLHKVIYHVVNNFFSQKLWVFSLFDIAHLISVDLYGVHIFSSLYIGMTVSHSVFDSLLRLRDEQAYTHNSLRLIVYHS